MSHAHILISQFDMHKEDEILILFFQFQTHPCLSKYLFYEGNKSGGTSSRIEFKSEENCTLQYKLRLSVTDFECCSMMCCVRNAGAVFYENENKLID